VAAPQFHENHVLTGTFAFNLLMGRRWPPEPEDLREAEGLCRQLGLGQLLERMPAQESGGASIVLLKWINHRSFHVSSHNGMNPLNETLAIGTLEQEGSWEWQRDG
jgi:hypothetical protein